MAYNGGYNDLNREDKSFGDLSIIISLECNKRKTWFTRKFFGI